MWKLPATVAAVLALSSPGLVAETQPQASDLAARIQQRYATVKDFTADFTLSQTSGVLPKAAVDHGKVLVKKPGKMRWTLETGSRNQVVADGAEIYSYFPKDRYVQVSPLPKGDQAPTALLLLTGRGDLARDFTSSLPASQPAGEWRLALAPKSRTAEFSSLTLVVDRGSLQLRGFVVTDTQGGVQSFTLTNLRENRGLTDKDFMFTIPKGVDIRR